MRMRNSECEAKAAKSAEFIREYLGLPAIKTAVILGTGWNDTLTSIHIAGLTFEKIPGFETLGKLAGHPRILTLDCLDKGKELEEIFVLRGRVHLNERPFSDASLFQMVRLQTEMLFHLGVKNLIVTNAAGSLKKEIRVGDIVVIDGFVTVFAPAMPLYGGEFCSPEDMLDEKLQSVAVKCGYNKLSPEQVHRGAYAMLRGPFFEGRRYDKEILRQSGASVVGMSTLPEACIAALYGVKMLGLSFVTNSDTEVHSHEENIARAKNNKEILGKYLANIISNL